MSIEKALADLQSAVEELTAAIKGKKGTPAAEEAEEEAAPKRSRKKKAAPKEVTLEEVRESMMALNTAKGKAAVVELLAEFSVKKIGDLEEKDFADAKQKADEAAAAEDEEEEEEEEDEELFK